MCISDWRLGRLIVSQAKAWSIADASTLVLPSNRQRVGLLLSHNTILTATAGYIATFEHGTVLAINGIKLDRMLTIVEHGSLVQERVTISQGSASVAGTFTEFLLPEEYLSAGLDQFISEYKNKFLSKSS